MVYVHYIAGSHFNNGGNISYWVWYLISADRNTTETLFRILQDNRGRTLSVPGGNTWGDKVFTPLGIKRMSPNFWAVETRETNLEVFTGLGAAIGSSDTSAGETDPVFNPVKGKMLMFWMGQYADIRTRIPRELSNGGDDFDLLSGSSFFVRRVGYTNSYWYCNGVSVYLSDTKRSRFRVTVIDQAGRPRDVSAQNPVPFIGSDQVVIMWSTDNGDWRRIGLDDHGDGLIVNDTQLQAFTFCDFVGRFFLQDRDLIQDTGTVTVQGLNWSRWPASHETFELCYGVLLS
ncbi:hypothetical protein BJY04DRAFT_231504 [Aspergillus karnatakaensis]|uniref:uncharacterized protein n=1 Tax=Aspergillus karnatakaensis TaxID=1810916 RepID=UPI003CCCBF01